MNGTLIEYVEFSNWLCGHKSDDVVGIVGAAARCPIANWLKQTREGHWYVYDNMTAYQVIASSDEVPGTPKGSTEFRLDTVLDQFVKGIDGLGQQGNGGDGDSDERTVTAIQCVRVLSLIIAEALGVEGYA